MKLFVDIKFYVRLEWFAYNSLMKYCVLDETVLLLVRFFFFHENENIVFGSICMFLVNVARVLKILKNSLKNESE